MRRWLAGQLGRPTGRGGRVVAGVLNRANRAMVAKTIEGADVRDGDRVLALGFGGGAELERLTELGARVSGADPSGDMVAAARRRFPGVELVEGTAASLPFSDERFDRVVSVNTLYFWPDAAAGLRELRRVLAADGRVALGIGRKADMAKRRICHEGFSLYDEAELTALLRAEGFRDVRVANRDGTVVGVGTR